ncbi:hypothetical protein GCM10018793_06170 [Streptomyces sulfonofaciens]|uniref:Uncharacterized protein n=1 Tax=Streptomyces sulfonofaciens TaxID=68272 RepID=A0A919KSR9_9ACTN|nr:hypothetical protein GCM10018793_06170 [Streptomyces sulfonofaciens]
MNPAPNALSALPVWIRRTAAATALVTLTFLKTSNLNFDSKLYRMKDFNAKTARAILAPWVKPRM